MENLCLNSKVTVENGKKTKNMERENSNSSVHVEYLKVTSSMINHLENAYKRDSITVMMESGVKATNKDTAFKLISGGESNQISNPIKINPSQRTIMRIIKLYLIYIKSKRNMTDITMMVNSIQIYSLEKEHILQKCQNIFMKDNLHKVFL